MPRAGHCPWICERRAGTHGHQKAAGLGGPATDHGGARRPRKSRGPGRTRATRPSKLTNRNLRAGGSHPDWAGTDTSVPALRRRGPWMADCRRTAGLEALQKPRAWSHTCDQALQADEGHGWLRQRDSRTARSRRSRRRTGRTGRSCCRRAGFHQSCPASTSHTAVRGG